MSLLHPSSSCPHCGHAIRWFDNVPIVGWLWLRGRCRDCKAKISIRYPLVEAATAALFVALAYTDVIAPYSIRFEQQAHAAAAEAPAGQRTVAERAEQPTNSIPTESFFANYAYHLVLLCTLLCAALIDFDGQKLPRQLITWPAAAGILMAMIWPAVQAMRLVRFQDLTAWQARVIAFGTSFLGMVAAVILRLGIFRAMRAVRPREIGLWNASLALYAVGAFLGIPAVVILGGATVTWAVTTQDPARKIKLAALKPTTLVFVLALAWCLFERALADWIHS
jgi:prepilin signal peptidase PulO-like enzyme (type II secretory pathway)